MGLTTFPWDLNTKPNTQQDDLIHDDDSFLTFEIEDRALRGAEFLYTIKTPDG